MRGKPLERETSDWAMIATGPSEPSGATRRTLFAPPSAPPDIQQTSAEPSASRTTSTRPSTPPSSTRAGVPNVAPASPEKATWTRGRSPSPVNHASATGRPSAATAGPLTGHALICQLSACLNRAGPADQGAGQARHGDARHRRHRRDEDPRQGGQPPGEGLEEGRRCLRLGRLPI